MEPGASSKLPLIVADDVKRALAAIYAGREFVVVAISGDLVHRPVALHPKIQPKNHRQSHNGPSEPESHDGSITIPKVRQFERGEARLDMDMEGFCLMVRR